MISNWTAAPVGNYVHVETADLYRPNARFTTETQGYQVLTPFGKLGYSQEIQCPTHGRVQEEIPWAPAFARISYRLEWRICVLCQIMTQKAAAEILRLPTSTLSNLLHRIITRVRHGHKIRGVTTLGVDEISYCKGRKFATLVYDLDRARFLWVGPGKGRDTIDRFFNECLSTGQKARNLLHRIITRVRHGHKIRGVTTLGVDEISYCKGRKFATLVYDLDRARFLWVGPGKPAAT